VVEAGFPAERTADALPIWESLGRPVRIASEYPALAEGFARSVQLSRTQIIPISGASEGFVPEDADILIEGSETGTSIRANGLKMLDPFMESTNCLIVRVGESVGPKDVVQALVERLESGALAAVG
jgi:ATP phosphoribosyltransferase